MKFENWLEEWLATCVRPTLKGRTLEKYERTVRRIIIPALGGYEMEDLYTDKEEQEIIAKLLSQWCERGKDFEENKNRYFQRLYRRGFSVGNISEQLRLFEEIYKKDCE